MEFAQAACGLSSVKSVKAIMSQVPMIAIVDDDEAVRISTASFVRSLGYRTRTFESAMAFLKEGGDEEPACMISDVQMPLISGPDLQDKLIAAGRRFPIIFMTAFPTEAVKERVLSAGAVSFLRKPFDGSDLQASLETALGDLTIH
ncbi:response regulator transcription factor [Chenggangzhangella methanolivorans]|nr:response regulator [Chenggangzhangella methanolivorans]